MGRYQVSKIESGSLECLQVRQKEWAEDPPPCDYHATLTSGELLFENDIVGFQNHVEQSGSANVDNYGLKGGYARCRECGERVVVNPLK